MRPGTGAAVGVVAELMDVDASFGRGIRPFDIIADGGGAGLGGLLEGDGAANGGVPTENGDCV